MVEVQPTLPGMLNFSFLGTCIEIRLTHRSVLRIYENKLCIYEYRDTTVLCDKEKKTLRKLYDGMYVTIR